MSKIRMTAIALGLALAVGCGKSGKEAKCEKGWDSYKEMLGAFGKMGGGDAAKDIESKMDAMKGMFISKCTSLPDDVVECVAQGIAADEACQKKLQDAGMGMGAKRKRSSDDGERPRVKKDEDKKADEPKKDDAKKDDAKKDE